VQKYLEKYLLPIAMVIGIIFHRQLAYLSPAIPFLLAMMLFFTYCRISWKDLKFQSFHYILLSIQYVVSIIVYLLLSIYDKTLAEGIMMCILTATATSAPVVTGLLNGDVTFTATYSIVSNLSIAIIAPVFLSFIGNYPANYSYFESFSIIILKVIPVVLLPFFLAILISKISPKFHQKIKSAQIVSFYLWAFALTLVIGNVTRFVIDQPKSNYLLEITLGVGSLILCLCQFWLGRKIGNKYNQKISGGQSLGQKNTVLAIWLSQTYLNPLSSLGPGLYVLWQNLVNSYQIWIHNKNNNNRNIIAKL